MAAGRILPPPHLTPDGEPCEHGSYFPTKEKWHGHSGLEKCPKCKADVSKDEIPKNRGGGGIEIDIPEWPHENENLGLYLWDHLDRKLELNYDLILLKILRMCLDNEEHHYGDVVIVSGSKYQNKWIEENIEKLNDTVSRMTNCLVFLDYYDAPDIFIDSSNTWITKKDGSGWFYRNPNSHDELPYDSD